MGAVSSQLRPGSTAERTFHILNLKSAQPSFWQEWVSAQELGEVDINAFRDTFPWPGRVSETVFTVTDTSLTGRIDARDIAAALVVYEHSLHSSLSPPSTVTDILFDLYSLPEEEYLSQGDLQEILFAIRRVLKCLLVSGALLIGSDNPDGPLAESDVEIEVADDERHGIRKGVGANSDSQARAIARRLASVMNPDSDSGESKMDSLELEMNACAATASALVNDTNAEHITRDQLREAVDGGDTNGDGEIVRDLLASLFQLEGEPGIAVALCIHQYQRDVQARVTRLPMNHTKLDRVHEACKARALREFNSRVIAALDRDVSMDVSRNSVNTTVFYDTAVMREHVQVYELALLSQLNRTYEPVREYNAILLDASNTEILRRLYQPITTGLELDGALTNASQFGFARDRMVDEYHKVAVGERPDRALIAFLDSKFLEAVELIDLRHVTAMIDLKEAHRTSVTELRVRERELNSVGADRANEISQHRQLESQATTLLGEVAAQKSRADTLAQEHATLSAKLLDVTDRSAALSEALEQAKATIRAKDDLIAQLRAENSAAAAAASASAPPPARPQMKKKKKGWC